jgi:glycolate oxidase iron-sulfur subunit
VNKKRNCNQLTRSAQAHPGYKMVRVSILPMATPFAPQKTAINIALLADNCVQCGLCLPHCPTYQLDRSEAESPRGRIAYMKALANGLIAPTDKGDTHLDHCLSCRRCEAACPANVEYGDLLALAREQQYLRKSPLTAQRLISGLLGSPRLLGFTGSLARLAGHLPALPEKTLSRHPSADSTNSKVAIFVGCIANTYETNTRLNLERLLVSFGFSVEAIPLQSCCGTAAVHLGDTKMADSLAEKNRSAFTNSITVLSLATGCHQQLARSLHAQNKVVDALDFIFQHAEKLTFKAANNSIALHIPCSQSAVVKSHHAARQLLAMVPGLHVHELADRGCCGAAGLHMLTEPMRATQLRMPLIEQVHEANVTQLLSSNIGCRLHIANGLKIPVRHPIDFLAEHLA